MEDDYLDQNLLSVWMSRARPRYRASTSPLRAVRCLTCAVAGRVNVVLQNIQIRAQYIIMVHAYAPVSLHEMLRSGSSRASSASLAPTALTSHCNMPVLQAHHLLRIRTTSFNFVYCTPTICTFPLSSHSPAHSSSTSTGSRRFGAQSTSLTYTHHQLQSPIRRIPPAPES